MFKISNNKSPNEQNHGAVTANTPTPHISLRSIITLNLLNFLHISDYPAERSFPTDSLCVFVVSPFLLHVQNVEIN
jgi:hypothetical protein